MPASFERAMDGIGTAVPPPRPDTTLRRPVSARQHSAEKSPYADFVEQLPDAGFKAKNSRTQAALLKPAGRPSVKTMTEYGFNFATGAP
ncbi:hypothetical protein [Neisseria musculi]|uniref:hypothetical protein n=1 Tax=Neisseria musculi TaxID=1815583 RepID=UPI001BE3F862|nr:hypothetical protein [Neisseria musculi]